MASNKLRYGRIDAIKSLKPNCLERNIFRTDAVPMFPEWDESKDGTAPTLAEIDAEVIRLNTEVYPLDNLRFIRDQLLSETDWTQNPDVPESTRTKWVSYRQALRDLPANTSDPSNPTWPTKPS
tara:strand:- start:1728 stop:2099 length:372 start_codon:yes stop_codon:yes gene_type:complete